MEYWHNNNTEAVRSLRLAADRLVSSKPQGARHRHLLHAHQNKEGLDVVHPDRPPGAKKLMLMTNRMLIHIWAAFSAEALPRTRGPPPADAGYGDGWRAGN